MQIESLSLEIGIPHMLRDRKKPISLEEVDDLYIEVYTIGYTSEGESCIFVLYCTKPKTKILYSIVIDCYEENHKNCTIEILEKLKKISPKLKLDMLIWTHPHDDHSIGIDKLQKEYCNKNTKIVTSNILNTPDRYSLSCNKIKNHLAKINYRQKIQWNISQTETLGSPLHELNFENAGDLISSLKIKCIAPCSSMICKENTDQEINKLSIGVLIEIERIDGNINFLFTGDLENQTIGEIIDQRKDEDIPYVYNYIKLPHHGGKSGESLMNLLDLGKKSKFGVSTVFRKTMKKDIILNPDEGVLKKYKNYIDEVACTADVFNKNYGIGIIKVVYDLKSKSVDIIPEGSAVHNIV